MQRNSYTVLNRRNYLPQLEKSRCELRDAFCARKEPCEAPRPLPLPPSESCFAASAAYSRCCFVICGVESAIPRSFRYRTISDSVSPESVAPRTSQSACSGASSSFAIVAISRTSIPAWLFAQSLLQIIMLKSGRHGVNFCFAQSPARCCKFSFRAP
jgi:hypothetical protein